MLERQIKVVLAVGGHHRWDALPSVGSRTATNAEKKGGEGKPQEMQRKRRNPHSSGDSHIQTNRRKSRDLSHGKLSVQTVWPPLEMPWARTWLEFPTKTHTRTQTHTHTHTLSLSLSSPHYPFLSPARPRRGGALTGKSRRRWAYPQQIVTTRLLYCLQDPFAHLSRLQRIWSRACWNYNSRITADRFLASGGIAC